MIYKRKIINIIMCDTESISISDNSSELYEKNSINDFLDFRHFFEDNIDKFSTESDPIDHYRVNFKLNAKKGRRKKDEVIFNSGHSKNKSDNRYNKIFRAFFKYIFYYLTLINNSFKFSPIFYKSQIYGARKLNDFFGNTVESFLERDEKNTKKINEIKESGSSNKFDEFFNMKMCDVYLSMFLPYFEHDPKCKQDELMDFAKGILSKYNSKKDK